MVFYFTATGNSLSVARTLEKAPVSIPQEMKKDGRSYHDGRIGIVCPIYGHELPPIVKDFLVSSCFETDYFYLILTYGRRHGGAAELAHVFCQEHGIRVDYINLVLMADIWLVAFDMAQEKLIDKHVPDQLETIKADIASRKHWFSPVTDADRAAHQDYLKSIAGISEEAFRNLVVVTDGCVGCGICTRVCPTGCMNLIDGRAVHSSDACQVCLACAHACPKKAIGIAFGEKNPAARYRNPDVPLAEIIAANCQS